jgi:nitrate reductase gamma subunit
VSDLLYFAEHTLQEVALVFMVVVYTLRLRWLLKFNAGKERQPTTGVTNNTTRTVGASYSLSIIAMPWEMESYRKHPMLYVQFVLFHIGVVGAIGLSFIIPYGPGLLEIPWMVPALQISIGAAFVVSCMRLIRRVSIPSMRIISSPDDYFSLLLLTVWFLFAFLAVPNRYQEGEEILLTYFFLTAFFLVYVPFSKISHYLYYPFTRYYFGKSMGHRGTFPMRRGAQSVST